MKTNSQVSDKHIYVFIKNPILDRYYLLPKMHNRLHNVSGGLVISNSGYFTENIFFIDFHLKTVQKVKSYIQDANNFLKKIAIRPPLPDGLILCTIDVVGLYPNMGKEKG